MILHEDIVTIEQPSKSFEPFKTNASNHRGIILSLLNKFRKDTEKGLTYTPLELKQVFEECLVKYNEIKKVNEKDVMYELLNWKGKDLISIYDGIFNEEFILQEHRKDKEGNVETLTHKIPHENVTHLLKFIKTFKINESKDCYAFSEYLGFKEWKDLWRERRIYFEVYYYPIKVLESLKVIKYSSKGKITRLK